MNQENPLEILNIVQLNESCKLIKNALNKACLAGSFNIDEAYLIKIAINNLEKSTGVLEKYQEFAQDLQNKQTNNS